MRTVSPAKVRRILSVASRTMRRWVRWDRNRTIQIVTGIGRKEMIEGDIAGGRLPIFGLQDQCYLFISFTSWSEDSEADC